MSCHKCYSDATLVYVVPDPYYGYGHKPKLCCDTCKPDDIFCDLSHKYVPDYDDYYLGITSKKPADWSYINWKQKCYTCKNEIVGDDDSLLPFVKLGSGYLDITNKSIIKRKIKSKDTDKQNVKRQKTEVTKNDNEKDNIKKEEDNKNDKEVIIVEDDIETRTLIKKTFESIYFCQSCFIKENDGQKVNITLIKTEEYRHSFVSTQ